jgi:site-specific DNA recombinase
LRVASYRRVSDEEREEGYSLENQRDRTRDWAAREGYAMVAEFEDNGWSGADLDRPGLDDLREFVASGGCNIVVVNKRDRLARGWRVRHLREEFEEFGTRLVALNVQAEDTPEGRLQEHVLDDFAEYEREVIADRMRQGRLKAARKGRLLGFRVPHYGFRFLEDERGKKVGYEVVPEQMATVRRIMEMVAWEGCTLHEAGRRLRAEGIRTAKGGLRWDLRVLKSCVTEDVYLPRTHEELGRIAERGQMSREVLAGLDPQRRYGVFWYGRRRVKTYKVREDGKIRKRTKSTPRDEEDRIAIPVPDSGLEPELVHAARRAVRDNRRSPVSHDRVWQLAGVLFCGCCGRRLSKHTPNHVNAAGEKVYRHYMRCPEGVRNDHECPNRKHLRVERIEEAAWEFVTFEALHPRRLSEEIDREIELLRRQVRLGDPEQEQARLLRDLAGVGRQREALQREAMELVAEGLLDRDLLRRKVRELDERERELEKELAACRDRHGRIEDLEDLKAELMMRYLYEGPEMMARWTPEQRLTFYRRIGFRAEADENGDLYATWLFGREAYGVPMEPTTRCSPSRRKAPES